MFDLLDFDYYLADFNYYYIKQDFKQCLKLLDLMLEAMDHPWLVNQSI
ncbi:hypothetical protein [uncultured Thomasclavelia sp.]|nr:hypothetical protein [uncultured Thomasclavelia sp.]